MISEAEAIPTKPSARVVLRREVIYDQRPPMITDGTHIYWKDPDGRVRWAVRGFADDGIGWRTHGAARTMQAAVTDAWSARCYSGCEVQP